MTPKCIAFTEEQVRGKLTEAMATEGPSVIAARCKVGLPYLYEVRKGNRPPSDKILTGLGLTRAFVALPPSEK